jgi:phosphotriesterase-related protein
MKSTTRADRRGKAQTVLGLVDPATLGRTLMHEHVLWDITPPSLARQSDRGPEITLENVFAYSYGELVAPTNLKLHDVAVAIDEVRKLAAVGGQTIVELSCGGLKPDPLGLVEISRVTSVQFVMGCGWYVDEYQEGAVRTRSVESLAQEMIDQVSRGAWGTGVCAGMLGEIGCQAPWTELEKRVMRAAVIAQRETGAAINVHPGRHPDQPQEVADFIRAAGGDLSRVVISHIDRTIFDDDRMRRLADTGVTLEFDLFGQESSYYKLADIDMPNDAQRLRHIRMLIAAGHLERVVISHDICYRSRLMRFGGHGYGHIFRNVVPIMKRRAFSELEIDTILIKNPMRLLTFI